MEENLTTQKQNVSKSIIFHIYSCRFKNGIQNTMPVLFFQRHKIKSRQTIKKYYKLLIVAENVDQVLIAHETKKSSVQMLFHVGVVFVFVLQPQPTQKLLVIVYVGRPHNTTCKRFVSFIRAQWDNPFQMFILLALKCNYYSRLTYQVKRLNRNCFTQNGYLIFSVN